MDYKAVIAFCQQAEEQERKWEQEIQRLKTEHSEEIKSLTSDKDELIAVRSSHLKEKEEWEQETKRLKTEHNETISTLKEDVSKLKEDISTLEKEVSNQKEELQKYEATCNGYQRLWKKLKAGSNMIKEAVNESHDLLVVGNGLDYP